MFDRYLNKSNEAHPSTHGDMGGGRASYGRDHNVLASLSEGYSKVKSAQQ